MDKLKCDRWGRSIICAGAAARLIKQSSLSGQINKATTLVTIMPQKMKPVRLLIAESNDFWSNRSGNMFYANVLERVVISSNDHVSSIVIDRQLVVKTALLLIF